MRKELCEFGWHEDHGFSKPTFFFQPFFKVSSQFTKSDIKSSHLLLTQLLFDFFFPFILLLT